MSLKTRFAGVLGQSSITVFNQGVFYFIAPDPGQTLNFPFGHGRDNQPRYRWEPQEEGVEFGYLVEGARA
jgi:hypothetical protein